MPEPGSPRIAVIGGGWAGLAAAVALCQGGARVELFEAAATLGGRARRVRLDGRALDNGQHILIGAYAATLGLMQRVGVDLERNLLRLPLQLHYADGFRLQAKHLPGRIPSLELALALASTRGLSWREKWLAARAMQQWLKGTLPLHRSVTSSAPHVDASMADASVADCLRQQQQSQNLCDHLWHPLCISALNTPPERASAAVFQRVLQDSLGARGQSGGHSDLLLPRCDLGALLPDAAQGWLQAHQAKLHTATAVKKISLLNQEVTVNSLEQQSRQQFSFDDHPGAFDAVVLAVAPQHAGALLAPLTGQNETCARIDALTYEPILSVYLQYPPQTRLSQPMLGFCGGLLQFVFDRGQLAPPDAAADRAPDTTAPDTTAIDTNTAGLMVAVISASGAHSQLSGEELLLRLHQELRPALRQLPADCQGPLWHRRIQERRATFACSPGLRRPGMQSGIPGLLLAGDYVDDASGRAPYPATLEAAVRSGQAAARAALEQTRAQTSRS